VLRLPIRAATNNPLKSIIKIIDYYYPYCRFDHSCIVHSRNVHPCHIVPICPLLDCPRKFSVPVSAGPLFSRPLRASVRSFISIRQAAPKASTVLRTELSRPCGPLFSRPLPASVRSIIGFRHAAADSIVSALRASAVHRTELSRPCGPLFSRPLRASVRSFFGFRQAAPRD